jgi:bacterioferritin
MDRKALIAMLNRDLTDEHAAVVRYLIHSYQEGEDTVMGASLLSRCREEMWHMHWLGMIICGLGGEPDFSIGPYPFDPASRESMLKSYIQYEGKLIPHYNAEAEKVDDPHIRRVLKREAWESAVHALRFQRLIEKLSPEDAGGLPEGGDELPPSFVEKLQDELLKKYTEMLQHIRSSWVFQSEDAAGWKIMDQAMEKMKHLAIFAEALAEDGANLPFKAGPINMSRAVGDAFRKAVDDLQAGGERYRTLLKDDELRKHSGVVLKMDLAVQQIDYQKEEIQDWLKK